MSQSIYHCYFDISYFHVGKYIRLYSLKSLLSHIALICSHNVIIPTDFSSDLGRAYCTSKIDLKLCLLLAANQRLWWLTYVQSWPETTGYLKVKKEMHCAANPAWSASCFLFFFFGYSETIALMVMEKSSI